MIQGIFLVFFLVFYGFLRATLPAQMDPGIIARAKQEGRVSYYTPMNIGAATLLMKSFEKEYPYLKVELFRQGGEALRTRVLSEAQAARHNFDVISMNILDVQLLKRRGLLTPYLSPESAAVSPGGQDREGFWSAVYVLLHVISFNTRMVPEGKIPRDWWDLLDPGWKSGKIGLDRDAVPWYASFLHLWGREKGIGFMKKLSAQRPHFERGYTLRTQLMAAGEFPIALAHAHKVEEFKAKGAPIDWVTTSNPIPAHPNIVAISSNAPHPNAARLFVDYVLSRKGQLVVQQGGNIPARGDIAPPTPSMDQRKLKLHYVDPSLAENYNQYQKEYQEIFR